MIQSDDAEGPVRKPFETDKMIQNRFDKQKLKMMPEALKENIRQKNQNDPSIQYIQNEQQESHFIKEIVESNNDSKQMVDVFEYKEESTDEISKFCKKILDHVIFTSIINFLTLYAIFGPDIRVKDFNKDADEGFDVLSCIAIAFFFLEILLQLIGNKEYFNSFFFWLDLISTISIFFDVTFIADPLFNGQDASTAQSASIAKAGRAGRIGARAGRVVRLIRLIRLVKIFKFYNKKTQIVVKPKPARRTSVSQAYAKNLKQSKDPKENGNRIYPDQNKIQSGQQPKKNQNEDFIQDEEEDKVESRISKKLSEQTTKRVIIFVLILILITPMLQTQYFFDEERGIAFDIELLQKIYTADSTDTASLNTAYTELKRVYSQETYPLLYAEGPGLTSYGTQSAFKLLRLDEIAQFKTDPNSFFAAIDIRYSTQTEAILSIVRTIFVCFVLGIGSAVFTKDANDIALRPIENMISKVNMIAANPMSAKEAQLKKIKGSNNDQYETLIIENAIVKLGVLLALGFGEAGSEIIASNMGQGDINPMMSGKKKLAIFGFCDIHHFNDVTEILKEDVMVFVNQIAEVVHICVDKCLGAANKNIGEAFLLVWRFEQKDQFINDQGQLDIVKNRAVKNATDLALIGFLKIIANLNREPAILAYRNNKEINEVMPNFKIKMGFGLHIGWAIEGAIGSFFKIDASYLSPNVNMSSRLEAACKQFGVWILVSDELWSKLSKKAQRKMRQIDRVTVKGSIKPIGLYTCDVDVTGFEPKSKSKKTKEEKRVKNREERKKLAVKIKNGIFKANSLFESDKSLIHIFRNSQGPLQEKFALALKKYFEGFWKEAHLFLKECIQINPDDGPSQALLRNIQALDFNAPSNWKGYRALTDK